MVKLTLIAAVSLNGVIGSDNDIPWKCPEDLKHFKETTFGHIVVMGRKTYSSLGFRPLAGRDNIVLTSNSSAIPEYKDKPNINCCTSLRVCKSITEIVKIAREISSTEKKIFIIGGGELYHQAIDMADKLIISHIHKPVKGNVKFPEIDLDEWMVEKIDHRLSGEIPFSIIHYTK